MIVAFKILAKGADIVVEFRCIKRRVVVFRQNHLLVRKTQQRVIGMVYLDSTAGFAEDRRLEIGEFQKRIDHLFGVEAAFAIDDLGDAYRILHTEIAVVSTIIDHPEATMHLGAGSNLEDQHALAIVLHAFRREDMRGIELAGIEREVDDIGRQVFTKFQTGFYADPVDAVFKSLGVQ